MTMALEGVEGSASRPGRSLPPGKDPVPIVQEAGWVPGPVWKVRKISLSPGFDPRPIQPVASRYTDYDTRPTGERVDIRKFGLRLRNCLASNPTWFCDSQILSGPIWTIFFFVRFLLFIISCTDRTRTDFMVHSVLYPLLISRVFSSWKLVTPFPLLTHWGRGF